MTTSTSSSRLGYAFSVKVNPDDFLAEGESAEAAKTRLLDIVNTVVDYGLDGEGDAMKLATEERRKIADAAMGKLYSGDTTYMMHANDSVLNKATHILVLWGDLAMGPVRGQTLKEHQENILFRLSMAIESFKKEGADAAMDVKHAGHRIGQGPAGVSVQTSLSVKGLTL